MYTTLCSRETTSTAPWPHARSPTPHSRMKLSANSFTVAKFTRISPISGTATAFLELGNRLEATTAISTPDRPLSQDHLQVEKLLTESAISLIFEVLEKSSS
eukprot:279878_1